MNLRWFHTPLLWEDAVEQCSHIGGVLFGDLDGSQAQLKVMTSRLETEQIWLGATAKYSTTQFVTLQGKDITDQIPFGFGQGTAREVGHVLYVKNIVNYRVICGTGGGRDVTRAHACQMPPDA